MSKWNQNPCQNIRKSTLLVFFSLFDSVQLNKLLLLCEIIINYAHKKRIYINTENSYSYIEREEKIEIMHCLNDYNTNLCIDYKVSWRDAPAWTNAITNNNLVFRMKNLF